MEKFPDNLINWLDIAKGVGEIVVDEAKVVLKSVFRMPHQLASHGDHTFPKVAQRYNRWDDQGNYMEDEDFESQHRLV